MESILGWLVTAVEVLLLFGLSIFVHEYGHYWMARRRGMRVDGFAIGFGPKIVSWMQDGVEWSFRWIPAGGFVKLPQMITSEAIEGRSDQAIPPASPVSRMLVAAAGPAMNVVLAFAIATVIWQIGLPVLVNPAFVGRVEAGSEADRAGLKANDQIVEVNGTKVRSWQEIEQEVALSTTNLVRGVVERSGKRIPFQLTARKSESLGMKYLDIEPSDRPSIGFVDPGTPAEKVGLQRGDKFVTFAGVHVLNQEHLIELVSKSQGKECELVVERDGAQKQFLITPYYDTQNKRGRIGIMFAAGRYVVQRPGPTPGEQFSQVLGMMGRTFSALWNHKQTGVGAKDLSGPVGILGVLAVETRTDFRLALKFMVMLNLNLALLNMLPIIVLDGGHIMMALYELVTRRRVSLKFQEYATGAFAVLLISFMLYVSFFDVTRRLPIFRTLLQQGSVVEQPAKAAPAGAQ